MQIILLEPVNKLGDKNEIVTVKNGFGRNFLIPQKKAIIASDSAKKKLAEILLQRSHKLEKIKEDARILANKLTGVSIQIEVKVSSTGKIFGSVNTIQIATELKKRGFEIERNRITIQDHIKKIGFYKAILRIYKDIIVEISFEVIAAPEPEEEKK